MKDIKKLDRFVHIKERVLDARRAELAEANHALQDASDRLAAARKARLLAIETLTSPQEKGADELSQLAQMVTLATDAERKAEEDFLAAQSLQEERTDEVAEANRDVKTLEVLRERSAKERSREISKRAQHASDEAAARIGG